MLQWVELSWAKSVSLLQISCKYRGGNFETEPTPRHLLRYWGKIEAPGCWGRAETKQAERCLEAARHLRRWLHHCCVWWLVATSGQSAEAQAASKFDCARLKFVKVIPRKHLRIHEINSRLLEVDTRNSHRNRLKPKHE